MLKCNNLIINLNVVIRSSFWASCVTLSCGQCDLQNLPKMIIFYISIIGIYVAYYNYKYGILLTSITSLATDIMVCIKHYQIIYSVGGVHNEAWISYTIWLSLLNLSSNISVLFQIIITHIVQKWNLRNQDSESNWILGESMESLTPYLHIADPSILWYGSIKLQTLDCITCHVQCQCHCISFTANTNLPNNKILPLTLWYS